MKFGPDFFSHIVIATDKINLLRCLRSALWQALNILEAYVVMYFVGLCVRVLLRLKCHL